MKRIALYLALAFTFALLSLPLATALVSAQSFPEYQGFVNDYAGLLTPDVKSQLEAKLSTVGEGHNC